MKKYDPAEHFGEEHVTPRQFATMLNVCLETARNIMRRSPKVISLPRTDIARKRKQETLRLPISEAKKLYVEMRGSHTAS